MRAGAGAVTEVVGTRVPVGAARGTNGERLVIATSPLDGPDVAGRGAVAVAVDGTPDSALIRRRTGACIPAVDGSALGQQRVNPCRPARIGERSDAAGLAFDVSGRGQAARRIVREVVAAGSDLTHAISAAPAVLAIRVFVSATLAPLLGGTSRL